MFEINIGGHWIVVHKGEQDELGGVRWIYDDPDCGATGYAKAGAWRGYAPPMPKAEPYRPIHATMQSESEPEMQGEKPVIASQYQAELGMDLPRFDKRTQRKRGVQADI